MLTYVFPQILKTKGAVLLQHCIYVDICVNTISFSERSPIPLANLNLLSFHKVLALGVCIKGQKPTQLCMIIMTVLLPVSIIMAAVAEET